MDGLWEVLAGIVLTLTATVVGVNALQSRGRDRALHGPIPGRDILPSVRRYNSSYRPPRFQSIRSRSPRLGVGRAVGIIAVVLIIAMAAFFATGALNRRDANKASMVDTHLASVSQRRMDAARATNPVTSWAIYIEADAMLDDLIARERVPGDDPRVLDEQAQITAAIAALQQSAPLGAVQVLGGVPDAPAQTSPQIIANDSNVWLLTDAVYRLDVTSSTLIRLLQPGDSIGETTVGQIRAIAWRYDRLLAVDATNAYTLNPATGTWEIETLGQRPGVDYGSIVTADTYDFNLYMLDSIDGQIWRFTAGIYSSSPEDWTGSAERQSLERAVDMAIDGHVWVLRNDGTVLDFFQSRLAQTIQPAVVPPLPGATALHVTPASTYVHVISSDGRILRYSRDGNLVQIFSPASGSTLLNDATAMTIDDVTGIAYILANGQVLTTRLPSPPPDAPSDDANTTPGTDESETSENTDTSGDSDADAGDPEDTDTTTTP